MLIPNVGPIMESQLLWEFIGFLKARWSARSRVDQRRRRLRQLVAMVRDGSFSAWLHLFRAGALRGQEVLDLEVPGCDAAAVVGSARQFVAGLRALLASSAEVDRLTDAVEELERFAGPGGDLDMFVKVLRIDPARAAPRAAEMEVDGGARDRVEEASSSNSMAGSVPAPGAKRKRAASSSGADGGSASPGQVDNNTVQLRKRRVLAWMRPHQWLPVGFGGLFAANRTPPPPVPRSHRARARAVAKAIRGSATASASRPGAGSSRRASSASACRRFHCDGPGIFLLHFGNRVRIVSAISGLRV